jgi:phage terminase large subunit-like protein
MPHDSPTYKLVTLKRQAQREGWGKMIRSPNDERALLKGYRFDPRKPDRVAKFFRTFLRHSKGSRDPFELCDWQKQDVVDPLFGWLRPDGRRRFDRSYVEIPKKNGKSTFASGIGLYMLIADGEMGAEVYTAATAKDQARIVWGEAANMVDASPDLGEILTVNRSVGNILFPATNSYLRVLAREPGSNEGWNAHCIIVDELHKWSGRQLWDALKWAFAARRQPLLFVITTAGDDPLSVCRQQHDYAQGVITGENPDIHFLPYIRAADPLDDWLDPRTWEKANPSLGITMEREKFAQDVDEAKLSPELQSSFKRYRLNVWNTGESTWLTSEAWKACRRTGLYLQGGAA